MFAAFLASLAPTTFMSSIFTSLTNIWGWEG